jgi:hypothetical protein
MAGSHRWCEFNTILSISCIEHRKNNTYGNLQNLLTVGTIADFLSAVKEWYNKGRLDKGGETDEYF